MASIAITNLTAAPLLIQDLYTTIAANATITVSRPTAALAAMPTLQAAVTAGTAAVAITLTANETASGLTTSVPVALAIADGSVTAVDVAPVAAATAAAGDITIRKAFTAGGAVGTPDDVTIYADNALPYKMRILDAVAIISTPSAGVSKLLSIRSAAAGAGTLCAEISSANAGHVDQTATVTASQVLTPGAGVGLFIRREDRDAVGEVIITIRRES